MDKAGKVFEKLGKENYTESEAKQKTLGGLLMGSSLTLQTEPIIKGLMKGEGFKAIDRLSGRKNALAQALLIGGGLADPDARASLKNMFKRDKN